MVLGNRCTCKSTFFSNSKHNNQNNKMPFQIVFARRKEKEWFIKSRTRSRVGKKEWKKRHRFRSRDSPDGSVHDTFSP